MALPIKIADEIIDLSREYTAEEFLGLPDDGNSYELIEGKLIMTPAPTYEHGNISNRLYDAIRAYLNAPPGTGDVWMSTGFYIGQKPNGKDNVPEPDLGFIAANRIPSTVRGYLPYPDLAIEVWSRDSDLARPSRLTRAREKLQMYLLAGTRPAWGINPLNQEVEIYHQGQTGPAQVLTTADKLDGGSVLPGFKISVQTLFQ